MPSPDTVHSGGNRVAFVSPRYGDEVVGGSESVMREAAHGLAARGWDVDMLTTCVRNHYTWANEYPPGRFDSDGITVHRFPVEKDQSPARWREVNWRVQLKLPVSPEEAVNWVNDLFRVPELYHHLVAHGHEYRAVVFSPYLFWTTVVGWSAVPERAVVMPCLHDEAPAYLSVFRPVLAGPAQVWFLSEPERDLALRLGPVAADNRVIGAGVHIPSGYDPDRFRKKYQLERPFLFYAGRREIMKGWPELLAGYTQAVTRFGLDLDLVTAGVGAVDASPAVADRVIDLGFLPEEEIGDAFAAAEVSVQPSRHESFSRTVMESWLAETPVIATAKGDVVRWHCDRSGGGLVYADDYELVAALSLIAERPDLARRLGAAGRDYVLANYTWDAVLDNIEAGLEALP
jgi:glycosyltransferase involved in cell wall biosynthesis